MRWLAGKGADTAFPGVRMSKAKAVCAPTPHPPHSRTLSRLRRFHGPDARPMLEVETTYESARMKQPQAELQVEVHPLTPQRWPDFEKLFGRNGACAGCWCMWWRLPAATWRARKGEGNRKAMQRLVKAGARPGLLAYADGQAVGWCAVAPREEYPRFATSRVLKPVDDQPVWSVTCFFIARVYRRRGITRQLLDAAAEFAMRQGGTILEGYPVEPRRDQPDAFVYTGLASAFRKAGFDEVAR